MNYEVWHCSTALARIENDMFGMYIGERSKVEKCIEKGIWVRVNTKKEIAFFKSEGEMYCIYKKIEIDGKCNYRKYSVRKDCTDWRFSKMTRVNFYDYEDSDYKDFDECEYFLEKNPIISSVLIKIDFEQIENYVNRSPFIWAYENFSNNRCIIFFDKDKEIVYRKLEDNGECIYRGYECYYEDYSVYRDPEMNKILYIYDLKSCKYNDEKECKWFNKEVNQEDIYFRVFAEFD